MTVKVKAEDDECTRYIYEIRKRVRGGGGLGFNLLGNALLTVEMFTG
jgi:hypothetical protein